MQSRTAIVSFVLAVAACGGRTGTDPLGDDAGSTGGAGGSTGGAGGSSAVDAKIDVGGLSCAEQTRLASARVDELVTEAHKDLSCMTNDDCINVDIFTKCTAGCTTYANLAGGKFITAGIADVNDNLCQGFAAKGCMIAVPPCPAPLPPRCLNGTCTPLR